MSKHSASVKERNAEHNEETCKRAKKRCLYLLQARPYTEYKLREKLIRGGYPQTVVEEAVAYVKSFHYIDDYEYACRYIFFHKESETRKKMEEKLMRKGVSRTDLLRAFENSYESGEEQRELELKQAKKLLEKRSYQYACSDIREQRKLYDYLARRGISPDIICRLLKTEGEEDC